MSGIENLKALQTKLTNLKATKPKGLKRGLMKAGLALQRESMKIVPVQTGNLRRSAFTRPEDGGLAVAVGYTAAYAIYVHENLDAAHGSVFNQKHADKIAKAKGPARKIWFNRGPEQQAKFLEKPFREQRGRLVQIVEAEILKEEAS